tara:strand:- start:500 stop:772 length:273 start_codon:yes stop_codon:yes gene_type:complete
VIVKADSFLRERKLLPKINQKGRPVKESLLAKKRRAKMIRNPEIAKEDLKLQKKRKSNYLKMINVHEIVKEGSGRALNLYYHNLNLPKII